MPRTKAPTIAGGYSPPLPEHGKAVGWAACELPVAARDYPRMHALAVYLVWC
ncbi:MAG: hypothetical protein KDA52_22075 [Planctomycetaceae bacterium]|nr:hypothetical protein [Planctomycetaceae bacterium]